MEIRLEVIQREQISKRTVTVSGDGVANRRIGSSGAHSCGNHTATHPRAQSPGVTIVFPVWLRLAATGILRVTRLKRGSVSGFLQRQLQNLSNSLLPGEKH